MRFHKHSLAVAIIVPGFVELAVASFAVTGASWAEFNVDIDETNKPVVEGETLEVTATVTNDGEEADTQDVILAINGTVEDTISVTLDPDTSNEVTLSWEIAPGDAGQYEANVSSANDSTSMNVTVLTPANATVDIVETNSPVIEDNPVEVDVVVANVGPADGTQNMALSMNGLIADREELAHTAGEQTRVTLL